MTKLRAAIVGSGLIAQRKHIPAFLKEKGRVELTALCDLNLQAAHETASNFNIPNAYRDFSEMLSTEKPNLIDICTPPQTHTRLAVEAMKHGCHVLIEKPMALTVQECDEIVNASRQYGVKVCIAHSDLFYWPFMKARELVSQGKIGDFRGMRIFLSTPTDYITSQKDHWVHKLPGGVIGETGPHVVYMTLAFIDSIREVNLCAVKLLGYPWSQFEDYRIELIGERAISSVTLSYASNQWAGQIDILGSEGQLLLDLQSLSLVKYRRPELNARSVGLSMFSQSLQLLKNIFSNGARLLTRRNKSTHDIIVSQFIDSIVQGTQPPVTAEEGREAVKVMDMIVRKLTDKSEVTLLSSRQNYLDPIDENLQDILI